MKRVAWQLSTRVMKRYEIWYLAQACKRYLKDEVIESLGAPSDIRQLAQHLWDVNVKAIQVFYPGDPKFPGQPGEDYKIKEDEPCPEWNEEDFRPLQVIAAANCYLCNIIGRISDPARYVIESLIFRCTTALPGWEKTEWGAPRPSRMPGLHVHAA